MIYGLFFYVILDLLNENTPWRICGDNKDDIEKCKAECYNNPEKLLTTTCNKKEFFDIFYHIKSLKYEDKPDYELIRNLLQKCLMSYELSRYNLTNENGIKTTISSTNMNNNTNNPNPFGIDLNNVKDFFSQNKQNLENNCLEKCDALKEKTRISSGLSPKPKKENLFTITKGNNPKRDILKRKRKRIDEIESDNKEKLSIKQLKNNLISKDINNTNLENSKSDIFKLLLAYTKENENNNNNFLAKDLNLNMYNILNFNDICLSKFLYLEYYRQNLTQMNNLCQMLLYSQFNTYNTGLATNVLGQNLQLC